MVVTSQVKSQVSDRSMPSTLQVPVTHFDYWIYTAPVTGAAHLALGVESFREAFKPGLQTGHGDVCLQILAGNVPRS